MNQKKVKKAETLLGWFLLIGSIVICPIALKTFAKEEPPFIVVLSCLALTLTAWDIVKTSRVNEEQEEENA